MLLLLRSLLAIALPLVGALACARPGQTQITSRFVHGDSARPAALQATSRRSAAQAATRSSRVQTSARATR